MAEHIELGQLGEILALQYLQTKGYELITTNWRYKRAEVDIIAKEGEDVIFVEVKTRKSDLFGFPEENVDHKKQRLLMSAAEAYIEENDIHTGIRFDVISIIMKDKVPEIYHITDAFFPAGDDY